MKTANGMLLLFSLWLTGCASLGPPPATIAETEPLTTYREVVMTVYGMSCPLCSNNLSGRLMDIQGVDDVRIDLDTGAVTVRFSEGHEVTRKDLDSAVKASGFTLKAVQVVPSP